ncbi:hypothetical protein COU76_02355 [Candidatus Peregrinibacteria bacterium CG10_big_fil_rev_8_21_14_0_10_49_10]|nr:MAG: hypothetical protein COU76_02355 [Candidatus Peregrinibacteria bacterium CG10_big_fil_rev_8_21_14_0_10_49_10]
MAKKSSRKKPKATADASAQESVGSVLCNLTESQEGFLQKCIKHKFFCAIEKPLPVTFPDEMLSLWNTLPHFAELNGIWQRVYLNRMLTLGEESAVLRVGLFTLIPPLQKPETTEKPNTLFLFQSEEEARSSLLETEKALVRNIGSLGGIWVSSALAVCFSTSKDICIGEEIVWQRGIYLLAHARGFSHTDFVPQKWTQE